MLISFLNRDVVDLRMNLRDRTSRSQSSSPVSSSSSNSGGGGGGGKRSGSGGGGSSHFRNHHCCTPLSLASTCSITSTSVLKSPVKASRAQRQIKRSNSAFEVKMECLYFSMLHVFCLLPENMKHTLFSLEHFVFTVQ